MKKFLSFAISILIIGTFYNLSFGETQYYTEGVSDTAYDASSWNGDTGTAASKNALRDKIETLGSGDGNVTGPSTHADGYAPLWGSANSTNMLGGYLISAIGRLIAGDGNATAVRATIGCGSAATRSAEDTMTNGSNLPDGAAIKTYGDDNWSGGGAGPLDTDFTSNGIMERKASGNYTTASTSYANAVWYGSDYNAIQAAIDTGAARVYVPSGTWSVTGNGTTTNGIRLRSNLELFGDGANETIISQASSAQFAIAVGTETSEGGSTPATDNYENIYIHDLQILGDVVTSGFSEHYHTMSISGVSDVLIERVWFEGFRGDGLYLGSTHTGATERHNERITVRDCIFDGINKDNRNGLSIIDCDGAIIENNYFTRTSKSTMPGAFDIEPNSNAFAIIKNITVSDNKFYDIGGGVAAISLELPLNQAALTTPSQNIIIENNHIDTCDYSGLYLSQAGTVSDNSTPNNIQITQNFVKNCMRGFKLLGIKTAQIKSNFFQNTTKDSLIGGASTAICQDIVLEDNTFLYCGTSHGSGLRIFYADKIDLVRNTFDDCGNSTTFGHGIDFYSGTSSYIRILNNTIIAPTGITTTGINKRPAHTFTPATNQYRGNDLHSLSNEFVSNETTTTQTGVTNFDIVIEDGIVTSFTKN